MKIRAIALRRAGFTLVELLVAMALIVLIMAILSQAFVEGLETFRHMKAVGDMQENMRSAIVPLRNDLLQRHFNGSEKLSVDFNDINRPTRGFLRVQQGNATLLEGLDGDGIPSYRAVSDLLHLTIVVVGDRRADYYSTDAPPTTSPVDPLNDPARFLWTEGPLDYRGNYNPPAGVAAEYYMNSEIAEVMWFLQPMTDADGQMYAGESDTPLYTLHRRHRLVVTDNNAALNSGASRIAVNYYSQYPEIATRTRRGVTGALLPELHFPSLADLIDPAYRSLMDDAGTSSMPHPIGTAYPPGSMGAGIPGIPPEDATRVNDDRVISDVVSFEIKLLRLGDHQFKDVRTIQAEIQAKYPAVTFPGGDGVYDTSNWPIRIPTAGDPTDVRLTIKAIQVTLRVWDAKTEQTRQVTMIQDL